MLADAIISAVFIVAALLFLLYSHFFMDERELRALFIDDADSERDYARGYRDGGTHE